jgi:hypothetical protein
MLLKTSTSLTLAALLSPALLAQSIVPIPAMTVSSSQIDFDNTPGPGPTTVAAINAAGTNGGATISNVLLTPSTAAVGVYNTNSGQGRALGMLAGQLELIDPNGTFDAFNAQIDLGGASTEFGIGIGDWVSTMILDFYLGGALVVSHTTASYSGANLVQYFQMVGGTFDRVDVRASTTAGNWVITELWIEGAGGGVGSPYCVSVSNSTGVGATLGATGSATVASNDLTLEAASLPTNAFGFFITSRTQGMVSQPGGSQGILCLGGSIGRYVGPGQIKNSGATGSFSLQLNLTAMPQPGGAVGAAPGDTWNFQAWYRDAVGGLPTSNFTEGLSVTFN